MSSSNDTPLKVEARFNPPFDMIIEPFREELREVNQAAKLKIGDVAEKIKATKNRILDELRCGPSETYSDSKNFRYKSWSKGFLVETVGVTRMLRIRRICREKPFLEYCKAMKFHLLLLKTSVTMRAILRYFTI